jgi:hypothetical protein
MIPAPVLAECREEACQSIEERPTNPGGSRRHRGALARSSGAGDLPHAPVYLRRKNSVWRSVERALPYATIPELAGEQGAQSLGTKRRTQTRRARSSEGGSRRAYIIVGLIAAVFVAGFAALVIVDARQKAASTPPGSVRTYDVGPAGRHTEADVNYAQTPPAGGPHNPVWQNCGFYTEPVRDENAVHSLEHGAVWITYLPSLPQGEVDKLRDLARSNSYVLVSPYPRQNSPVVATAWGKQLALQSADDPELERFIGAYEQGPQTPEPGAACSGGTGNPA